MSTGITTTDGTLTHRHPDTCFGIPKSDSSAGATEVQQASAVRGEMCSATVGIGIGIGIANVLAAIVAGHDRSALVGPRFPKTTSVSVKVGEPEIDGGRGKCQSGVWSSFDALGASLAVGTGKSALLRRIHRALKPTTGTVHIGPDDVWKSSV